MTNLCNDVILGLQGEVLGSKAGQLKLDLEFVIACRDLDVVSGLSESCPGHTHGSGAKLGQPSLQAGSHAVLQVGKEGVGEEGRPL